jgi:TonB family protein
MNNTFVVEQIVGVTVVFGTAALAAWVLRKHSAASRHMVWWLAASAALLLPLASLVKPQGTPTIIRPAMQSDIVVTATLPASEPTTNGGQVVFAAWLAGFGLLFGRLCLGLVRSSRRKHSSEPAAIPSPIAGTQIRLSSDVDVPETFGMFRPVILLPVEASEWSAERIRIVVAHEFIHIQRRDWLTQLIAQFTACVYWFHPLAWIALKQMRKEREIACDDGVLRLGYKNSDYAQHLVDVARSVRSNAESLSPSVAMACRSQLETRVRAILNPANNRGNVTRMMKVCAMACTVAAIVFFSTVNSAAATTSVAGVVSDPSGARLPDAMIMLTPTAKGEKPIATTSNSSGEWEVRTLNAGDYRLEVKVPGFRAHLQQISVTPDRTTHFDVQLNLGSIQETITVQGETSYIPRATSTPQRIRVGGNVQPPKLLTTVRPDYPQHLKDAGISGVVIMRAVISREGDVLNAQTLSPEVNAELIAAAENAVRQWKYQPTLLNGVPVEVVLTINVNFTLARKE